MRPRHKAAENRTFRVGESFAALASMRPRHKAAENEQTEEVSAGGITCFNEAAA